jgi:hypothetical protein
MTPDDRATLVRLIAATIYQHAKGDLRDLAERIADDLEVAGYEIVRPGQSSTTGSASATQSRPHRWPLPGASGSRGHCLVCGAAYGGARAQGPCEPPG